MIEENARISIPKTPHWIDYVPAPSFLCDDAGDVYISNQKSQELFGFEESPTPPKIVANFVSPSSVDDYLDRWESRDKVELDPTTDSNAMIWVRTVFGTELPVHLSIGRVADSGKQLWLVVFGDALRDSDTSASEAIALAEHLASVRHQFRNPLAGIIVLTDLLLRDVDLSLGAKQISQLQNIRQGLRRMAIMINDIDVLRPEHIGLNRRNIE